MSANHVKGLRTVYYYKETDRFHISENVFVGCITYKDTAQAETEYLPRLYDCDSHGEMTSLEEESCSNFCTLLFPGDELTEDLKKAFRDRAQKKHLKRT